MTDKNETTEPLIGGTGLINCPRCGSLHIQGIDCQKHLERFTLPSPHDAPTQKQRVNRIALCKAADEMKAAIKGIETSPEAKNELTNMATALLRMSLALNDGCLSPSELRSW